MSKIAQVWCHPKPEDGISGLPDLCSTPARWHIHPPTDMSLMMFILVCLLLPPSTRSVGRCRRVCRRRLMTTSRRRPLRSSSGRSPLRSAKSDASHTHDDAHEREHEEATRGEGEGGRRHAVPHSPSPLSPIPSFLCMCAERPLALSGACVFAGCASFVLESVGGSCGVTRLDASSSEQSGSGGEERRGERGANRPHHRHGRTQADKGADADRHNTRRRHGHASRLSTVATTHHTTPLPACRRPATDVGSREQRFCGRGQRRTLTFNTPRRRRHRRRHPRTAASARREWIAMDA